MRSSSRHRSHILAGQPQPAKMRQLELYHIAHRVLGCRSHSGCRLGSQKHVGLSFANLVAGSRRHCSPIECRPADYQAICPSCLLGGICMWLTVNTCWHSNIHKEGKGFSMVCDRTLVIHWFYVSDRTHIIKPFANRLLTWKAQTSSPRHHI